MSRTCPPHLNRPLVLETPLEAPDNSGGFEADWLALGTLWADVVPGSGRETSGVAADPLSVVRYQIVVRGAPYGSPARPTPGQRFREGERIYRIHAVAERDHTGRYLTCYAEEELAA
ncbi:head-tail adaptor protein [Chachezhania antarctica]|uniref:head-tail adaptor protein n=1 Tax=Chachezhania antarctica TaxID=2340860 RepID=UPI000EB27058|nr:head-tail adaptor protein [Chachezhania antarctica]